VGTGDVEARHAVGRVAQADLCQWTDVALEDTMSAYDTFADAASTHALKVVLAGSESGRDRNGRVAAGATTA